MKVLIIDSGISEKQKKLIKTYDIGLGWSDDHGHGSLVTTVITNILKKEVVEFASIKILNKNKEGNLEDLVEALKLSLEIKCDIICLPLAFEQDIHNEYFVNIIHEINNQGIKIVSSFRNGSFDSYPAKIENVFAVMNELTYEINYKYNKLLERTKRIKTDHLIIINADTILGEIGDGKYSFLGGNSLSCAKATAYLAIINLTRQKGFVGEIQKEIETILIKENSKKLNIRNRNLNEKNSNIIFDTINQFDTIQTDLKSFYLRLMNESYRNFFFNQLKRCGFDINKCHLLELNELKNIDIFIKYLYYENFILSMTCQ